MLKIVLECVAVVVIVGGGATAFIIWNTGTLNRLNKILKSKDLK